MRLLYDDDRYSIESTGIGVFEVYLIRDKKTDQVVEIVNLQLHNILVNISGGVFTHTELPHAKVTYDKPYLTIRHDENGAEVSIPTSILFKVRGLPEESEPPKTIAALIEEQIAENDAKPRRTREETKRFILSLFRFTFRDLVSMHLNFTKGYRTESNAYLNELLNELIREGQLEHNGETGVYRVIR